MMCGIVGYVGRQAAEPILVDGLARLEYRGYDSAGVATLDNGVLHVRRAMGKLAALRGKLQSEPCPGSTGIGHTRWATHGKPSEVNAHPHTAGHITVVHNGIIENHQALRSSLMQRGRVFVSETDTEIFAHLITMARDSGRSLLQSVQDAVAAVEGAYALAVLDDRDPTQLAFAKQASPLVVGVGQGEMFLASDIPAVLAHTRDFVFLEDGDIGTVSLPGGLHVLDASGATVTRPTKRVEWSIVMAEKGGHKHFMHKEIFEQPRAITDTLRGRLSFDDGRIQLDGVHAERLRDIDRVIITACGTSWHAGLVAKYWLEQVAKLPTEVELASELRYREPILTPRTLVLAISQSGETADTLAAMKDAKKKGACIMAVCNVVDAAIPRLCEDAGGTLYTRAGPEIGVASTKAFVTQLVALQMIALFFAQQRGHVAPAQMQPYLHELARLPLQVEQVLGSEEQVKSLAHKYVGARDMLFLGRGTCFPIALEGALKLKEISYIHAEGYAAGEMKHGPIALIDEHMPVVVLALHGPGYEKVVSNLEEVRARGGRVVVVVSADDHNLDGHCEGVMRIPAASAMTAPILAVVPLQLWSYHIADQRGLDVDQPRNLAKSVTVE
jgi:glutamine---fructose-6-phosphate transaminase (isomerizing)